MRPDKITELYFSDVNEPIKYDRRKFLKKLGKGIIVIFSLSELSLLQGWSQGTPQDKELDFNAYLRVKEDGRVDCYTGKIEMGHARAMLGLETTKQLQAAREVAKKGLSVRGTEQLVRRLNKPEEDKKQKAGLDPDTRKLQEDLSEKLGAKVVFQHSEKGKGKMLIHYNSIDELDGILEHIK